MGMRRLAEERARRGGEVLLASEVTLVAAVGWKGKEKGRKYRMKRLILEG